MSLGQPVSSAEFAKSRTLCGVTPAAIYRVLTPP